MESGREDGGGGFFFFYLRRRDLLLWTTSLALCRLILLRPGRTWSSRRTLIRTRHGGCSLEATEGVVDRARSSRAHQGTCSRCRWTFSVGPLPLAEKEGHDLTMWVCRCRGEDEAGKKKNLFEEKGVHRKQESDNVCTLQHRDDSSKLSERVRNIESPDRPVRV